MTKPGPRPKSAEQRRQAGNPGNRPINENEPAPVAGAPPKPDHLDEVASQTWDWLVDKLDETRTLRTCDQSVMTRYCIAWSRNVALAKAIHRQNMVDSVGGIIAMSDKGQTYISASASAESMYSKMLADAEKKLGLSPADRLGIQADPLPAHDPQGKDRFFPKVVG